MGTLLFFFLVYLIFFDGRNRETEKEFTEDLVDEGLDEEFADDEHSYDDEDDYEHDLRVEWGA